MLQEILCPYFSLFLVPVPWVGLHDLTAFTMNLVQIWTFEITRTKGLYEK